VPCRLRQPARGRSPGSQDPFERFNRASFCFNDALDTAIVKPAAEAYTAVLPEIIRSGVANFFAEPRRRKDDNQTLELVCLLHITLLELADTAIYLAGRRVNDLVRRAGGKADAKRAERALDYRERIVSIKQILRDKSVSPERRLSAIEALIPDDIGIAPLNSASLARESVTTSPPACVPSSIACASSPSKGVPAIRHSSSGTPGGPCATLTRQGVPERSSLTRLRPWSSRMCPSRQSTEARGGLGARRQASEPDRRDATPGSSSRHGDPVFRTLPAPGQRSACLSKCSGEYGAVRGSGLEVTLAALVGEDGEDAAAVGFAHDALDEAVAFHSGDQPACGALAQVHDVGEVLGAALDVLAVGEGVESFELADADAVTCLQLPLQGLVHNGMPGYEIVPLLEQLPLVASLHVASIACNNI